MNTYYSLFCPKCEAVNLVDNGDESDLTCSDVQTFRCWSCDVLARMPEEADGECTVHEDQSCGADVKGKRLA